MASGTKILIVVIEAGHRLCVVSHIITGSAIEGAVEHVEGVDLQAEGKPFGDLRIFDHAEVGIVGSVTAESVAAGAGIGITQDIGRELIVRDEVDL